MSVAISIVIPVHNPGQAIIEALDSCLNQTFKDFEMLLVNNHSSPETLELIRPYFRQYPEKLRMVDEPRRGVCSARNRGILEAKGPYVALLDQDDIMYPQRLESQLLAAEKNPNAALIHGLFDRVTPDNLRILKKGISGTPEFWRILLFNADSHLAQTPTVPPSVMFFKKDAAIRANLFDEFFNPQWLEDTEFCLKMSEIGPFILVNESLVRWRFHSEAYVMAREKRDLYIKLRNMDRFYRILHNKYESPKTSQAFRKMRGQWLREASKSLLPYRRDKHISYALLNRSLSENPFDWKTWKLWIRTFYPMSLWPSVFHFDEWVDDILPENLNSAFANNIFQAMPPQFNTHTLL